MKLRIVSFRGDHNCELADVAVAEAIYNKVSGKSEAALSPEIKAIVPDNFAELEKLWKPGLLQGLTPFGLDKEGNMVPMKEFNPDVAEMVVLQPIQAG